jgi:hypothetical protein
MWQTLTSTSRESASRHNPTPLTPCNRAAFPFVALATVSGWVIIVVIIVNDKCRAVA